jgi:hypothetical protein
VKRRHDTRDLRAFLLCTLLPALVCLAVPKDWVFFVAYALAHFRPALDHGFYCYSNWFLGSIKKKKARHFLMAWLLIAGFMVGISIVIRSAEQEWARILDISL